MAEPTYEVSFSGVASAVLRAAFDDCVLEVGPGTTTVICGHDALQGVLHRVQDLGLNLLDVQSRGAPPLR